MHVIHNIWVLTGDGKNLQCAVSWFQKSSVETTFHLLQYDALAFITTLDISQCKKLDGSTVVTLYQP